MNNAVFALAVFDDGLGSGPALYAGGWFSLVGDGTVAVRIAKWDGKSWSPLGSGVNNSGVLALTVFDDGMTGRPALYAGGTFTVAGGAPANRVARWDGVSWSALGSGLNDSVSTLTIFDDGTGPAIYAGSAFTAAGGVAANRAAKWDGASWSALDGGVAGGDALALAGFDDGSGRGSALYVGGAFNSSSASDSYLAR